MTQMTLRQIFDKVRQHLLTQKRQSTNRYGECAYRGTDGLKCAIGCLVPDDQYRGWFEGTQFFHWKQDLTLTLPGVDLSDQRVRDMLRSLQVIHDQCALSISQSDPAASHRIDRWPILLQELQDILFPKSTPEVDSSGEHK